MCCLVSILDATKENYRYLLHLLLLIGITLGMLAGVTATTHNQIFLAQPSVHDGEFSWGCHRYRSIRYSVTRRRVHGAGSSSLLQLYYYSNLIHSSRCGPSYLFLSSLPGGKVHFSSPYPFFILKVSLSRLFWGIPQWIFLFIPLDGLFTTNQNPFFWFIDSTIFSFPFPFIPSSFTFPPHFQKTIIPLWHTTSRSVVYWSFPRKRFLLLIFLPLVITRVRRTT